MSSDIWPTLGIIAGALFIVSFAWVLLPGIAALIFFGKVYNSRRKLKEMSQWQ